MRYDEITGESRGEVYKKLREKHGGNAVLIKIYEADDPRQPEPIKSGFLGLKKKKAPEPKKIWIGKCGIPENEDDWKQLEKGYGTKKIQEEVPLKPEIPLYEAEKPKKTEEIRQPLESGAIIKLSEEFAEMKLLLHKMMIREVDEDEKKEEAESQKSFRQYLLKNDFSLDFCEKFIASLTVPAINLETFEVILKEKLRLGIPVSKGFHSEAGRFFMLMGPTGVGKTTTLAKLAAVYYGKNQKIRFLSFDSYRLGAARQLEMYAGIFERPFHLVQNEEEMKDFLKTLKDDEFVFIDTAGESVAKDLRLSEVNGFLKMLPEKVTRILVLPACGKSADLEKIKEKFRVFSYDYYIITKLDETLSAGAVLSALYKDQNPVAYLTYGQEVPEDMAEGDMERLLAFLKTEA